MGENKYQDVELSLLHTPFEKYLNIEIYSIGWKSEKKNK